MSSESPVPRDRRHRRVLDKFKRWIPRRGGSDHFPALRFALASLIIIIWSAIYIRAFIDTQFHVPEGLSGVALAASTYLFGSGLFGKKGEDE